jgi:hypothetical protein
MMETTNGFRMPPRRTSHSGRIRRVGFEMEMQGGELSAVASTVAQVFGGELIAFNSFVYQIMDSPYGDITVELDSSVLKDRRYRQFLNHVGIEADQLGIGRMVEQTLARIAGTFVPHEIVLPPIPLDRIGVLKPLVHALHRCHAKGKASMLYAFNLQINPEIPSSRPQVLVDYLKSFLLLYDWLFRVSDIDLTRRISPIINEFPAAFCRQILDPDYYPDLPEFIDDYLLHNPTGNRPLDFLPLFAFLDERRVRQHPVEWHRVKPRAAFHYRLPNCRIDEPGWSAAIEWNRWVEVEKLAALPDKIVAMSRDYLQTVSSATNGNIDTWVAKSADWIDLP